MSGREVLVTGAAGFVGRHVVTACRRAGLEVTAVDLRPAPQRLARSARWLRGDFAGEALLAEVAGGRFAAVLHQAGISDTGVPEGVVLAETNTLGPLRIAQACQDGAARFVYASSHSVYGFLRRREPIAEDAEDDPARCSGPLNPYAHSKLALDVRMRKRYATGLDWVGLRYTNVFGADERDKGSMASILSQLLHQAATSGRVRVFGDSLTAARDYVPVEVVAETVAMLAVCEVPSGIYNLGAGYSVSFAELLQWCFRLCRQRGQGLLAVELVPNPVATAYQYYTCADMSALDEVLPGRPQISSDAVELRAAELFALAGRSPGAESL